MRKTFLVFDLLASVLILYATYSAEMAALPSALPGSVTQQTSYPGPILGEKDKKALFVVLTNAICR